MTLREFVKHGSIGTHAEREAFETGMLEAFARQEERRQLRTPLDRDTPEEFWIMTFGYAKLTLAQAGRPLGLREV